MFAPVFFQLYALDVSGEFKTGKFHTNSCLQKVYKKCLFSLTVGEFKTEQNDLQVQKSKKKKHEAKVALHTVH